MMLQIGYKGATYCVYGSYHRGRPSRDSFNPPEQAYFNVFRIERSDDDKDISNALSWQEQGEIAIAARDICEAGGDE